MKPLHISLLSLLVSAEIVAVAQAKYPVQPSDCVNVRYLSTDSFHRPIQINPQSTLFAYLVKSPNLATNHNDGQIYIRHLAPPQESDPKPILVGENISEIRWLSDGIHLALLIQYQGHTAVGLLHAITRQLRIIASAQTDIQEYSIYESGKTIAYALEEEGNGEQLSLSPTLPPGKEDIEKGYRIPMEPPSVASYFPHRRVYLIREVHAGSWSRPEMVSIEDPFTGRLLTSFPYHQRLALSLSPNGRDLLLRYIAGRDHLPSDGETDAWLNHAWNGGFPGVPVQVAYHLPTKQTTIPFPSPFALSVPIWSKGSDAFAVVAESPVGSTWADEEARTGTSADKGIHLFYGQRAQSSGKGDRRPRGIDDRAAPALA